MTAAPIPTFYLYGEPHRSVDANFVHVERLDDRSRPSGWTIHPHSHVDLNHFILISDGGGGAMRIDGEDIDFVAPALLIIPASTVHGFVWKHDSEGWVVTIAQVERIMLSQGDGDLAGLFAEPRAIALRHDEGEAAAHRIESIARELAWSASGRQAAVRAALLDLMVLGLRAALARTSPEVHHGRHGTLVARFREQVEQCFRTRRSLRSYASDLGVSESTLREACAIVASNSPMGIIAQRVILEARRLLIYSDLTVSGVGYSLGFIDPAYFSRFFARYVGKSPQQYRKDRGLF